MVFVILWFLISSREQKKQRRQQRSGQQREQFIWLQKSAFLFQFGVLPLYTKYYYRLIKTAFHYLSPFIFHSAGFFVFGHLFRFVLSLQFEVIKSSEFCGNESMGVYRLPLQSINYSWADYMAIVSCHYF